MYVNESNKEQMENVSLFQTAQESIKLTKMHTFIGYWNRNLNALNDVQTDMVQRYECRMFIRKRYVLDIDKKNYCDVWPIN